MSRAIRPTVGHAQSMRRPRMRHRSIDATASYYERLRLSPYVQSSQHQQNQAAILAVFRVVNRMVGKPAATGLSWSAMLLSMFIRSGISNRSFMQSCCVFATSFHTGHAYNELGGDRHVRPIRPRKEPGSSDATRSAAAYRISRRMEEEASGAHCQ